MAHTQRKAVLLAAVLGLLALVAVVMTSTSSNAADGSTDSIGAGDLSVLTDASAAARDSLAEPVEIWMDRLEASEGGKEVTSFGVVNTSAGEVTVAGIGENACLYLSDGGVTGCADLAHINSGEVFLVKPGCDTHLVIGLEPDGVSELAVKSESPASDGSGIDVTSNVYVAELPAAATTLTGTTEAGEIINVDVPLDITPTNCF